MDEHQSKLVELTTDAKMRAIAFDVEIALDQLKYSAWCTAFATAGLGLVLSSWDKIVPASFSGSWKAGSLLAVAVPLAISILVGAYVHWLQNKRLAAERHLLTFALKQQVILFADDNVVETGRALGQAMMDSHFLSSEDQDEVKKYKATSGDDPSDVDRFIAGQQIAAVLGFASAICVAFMRWLGP